MAKIKEALKATQEQLQQKRNELLETMGVQLLTDIHLDYRTKARGGTGVDGIKWKPLAESTIEKKNRKGAKQSRTAAKRAQKQVDQKKRGRPSNKTKAAKSFLASSAGTEIGVDTGLQRASAQPGFQGGDGKGGNLFEIDDTGVTVGFAREYSVYFDEDRTLLPETLPEPWAEAQEEVIKEWAQNILDEGMKEL